MSWSFTSLLGMFYNILSRNTNVFHSLVRILKTPQNVNGSIFDFIFRSFCSSRERSVNLSSSLNSLEKSQGDLENKLGSIQDQHQQDASKLKIQLTQAESRTKDLQKEVQATEDHPDLLLKLSCQNAQHINHFYSARMH